MRGRGRRPEIEEAEKDRREGAAAPATAGHGGSRVGGGEPGGGEVASGQLEPGEADGCCWVDPGGGARWKEAALASCDACLCVCVG